MVDSRSVALRIADMKQILADIETMVNNENTMLVIVGCEQLEVEVRGLKQLYKHSTLY